MKLQRFFVGLAIEADRLNTLLYIPSLELTHQLSNVFRYTKNDKVILFDNSGYQYMATIDSYDKKGVSFSRVEKHGDFVEPLRETYLFASIVKKDTFEWIVEKATELGVTDIIPVVSERSEKKNLNIERLTKVIIEAAEQSGRVRLPRLHSILKLAEAIDNFKYLKPVVWEINAPKFTQNDLAEVNAVYIGPEGGWTEKELANFKSHNIPVLSLGSQVLRAETAVVATLSQIVF